MIKLRKSHLLQMRGLKHTKDAGIQIQYLSHLLQMRGLKLFKYFNTGF